MMGKGKKHKRGNIVTFCIYFFVSGLLSTICSPQEVAIENTKTATVKEIKRSWNAFAHEYDWRVTGPGRRKIYLEDGTPIWRQLIYPEEPKGGLSVVVKLDTWDALTNIIKSNPKDSLECFKELELSIPKEHRDYRFELKYLWYAVASALDPELFESSISKETNQAIKIFKKRFGIATE